MAGAGNGVSDPYIYEYPRPSVTVDIVILRLQERRLEVLLIKRGESPYRGRWALPGGFVHVRDEGTQGEALDAAALRELKEETGLDANREGVYLEQLYTFGAPKRDPRGRVISVVYYALLGGEARPIVRGGDDAADARWFELDAAIAPEARPLAFDHRSMLELARERIRGKIDWVPDVAAGLVPSEFTQKELRTVHEVIRGQPYDRSNFAKRFRRLIEEGYVHEAAGTRELRGAGRPPRLYRWHTS